MPLDPYFVDRLSLLDDISSYADVQNDEEKARRFSRWLTDEYTDAPACEVSEEQIQNEGGSFTVRIYFPPSSPPEAALVWAHGGGFVGGDLDMPEADGVARDLAARHAVAVVSVGYDLANGTTVHYPQLHRQVMAAFQWATEEAAGWGISAKSVSLGGASAGGALAVAACLELSSRGERLPHRLLLAYPLLHRHNSAGKAVDELMAGLPEVLRFPPALTDLFFSAYVGTNGHASYASVEGNSLSDLPPTLVIVAEYDDLQASGRRFHEQALSEGISSTLLVANGMPHGFLNRSRSVALVGTTIDQFAMALTDTPTDSS